MITAEWDIPFVLQTPAGNLPINTLASIGTSPLGYYMLDPSKCSTGAARRVTRSNIAQAGGEITHRKYKTGYVMELNMQLWETVGAEGKPACGAVLREMVDNLMLYLNSIDNDDGRISWTPSANPPLSIPNRMLNPIRMLGPSGSGGGGFVTVVAEKDADGPLVTLTFALLSPRPYAWDEPETVTHLGGSTPVIVTNGGNSEFHPVFEVFGPFDNFRLVNNSNLDEQGNPLEILYAGALLPDGISIGGSDFAEIDTFRNTIYRNGSSTNLKPGVDILRSDFWTLLPGDNEVEIFGASADMKWQNAYA